MSIEVRLPDDSLRQLPEGATGADLAGGIGARLLEAALAIKVDGHLVDLKAPLVNGAKVEIVTNKAPESLELIRHSTAHLLAHAVKRLYPGAKVGIGPVIEDGFYYDFWVEKPFTPEDLPAIEAEMAKIVAEGVEVIREDLSRDAAVARFTEMGEPLKVEVVSGIPSGDIISGYRQGDFYDLCRGPHVPSTSKLKAFKLLSIAGAYWKGDEKNQMLSRIYGTAFHSQKELDEHLKRLEEAKARDHRKLGKELGLYSFHPEAPASPFFHPKGTQVYNELVTYMRELYFKYGYSEVITPQVLDVALWKTSGHYENYAENMYFTTAEEREYALKPMNCPGHCIMFGSQKHSYRDLPIRYADFGRLHRYERSGVTHGLTRVRTFCQDDAHIYCTPDQIKAEMADFLALLKEVYDTFGFDGMRVALSTRPEKRLGSEEIWDTAENALSEALNEAGMPFTLNPGEGAFYGPKIEFQILDALKRPWQLGTLQVDYMLPERFDLNYTRPDGGEGRPIMLHRAILGSLERFMGILVEHTAGAFPAWLAPVQVAILPITDRANAFATEIAARAKSLGLRAELDARNESLKAKIREAQLAKVPYMLVIGDREAEAGTVSVRHRHRGDLGVQPLEGFLQTLATEVQDRQR
ncbi:MAG: threonine--tRNA ligase [Holophagaceae bacterium]|uniref:Threonine--tRNA ligase n=1 Tax=Candidatus Geothrix odensensis TaxID=2954440 RepID=A0A936F0E6_9BACT|nr:threonine--tRNA ligase [Candidatus Geothrix odensensis]